MSNTIRGDARYFPFLFLGLIGCNAKNDDKGTKPVLSPSEAGVTHALPKKSISTDTTDHSTRKEAVYEGKPTSYWVAQLRDASWRTRSEAAKVLAILGSDNTEVIPALLLELKHNDPFDQQQVARTSVAATLATIGAKSPQVVSAMTDRLQDQGEDQTMRRAIALALGKSGSDAPDVIEALIGALNDGSVKLRSAAVDSLREIGTKNPKVTSALIEVIDDREARVRAAVIKGVSLVNFLVT